MGEEYNTPPPPLDDPTVAHPLECPPLRWGLIGCGRVSHDFAQALRHIPTASIVACAARELDRAQEFATKHGIVKAYGDYDEMLKDPAIDVVYVGNLHAFRRSIGEKCLLANKHVLLEKPFACKLEDAEYLCGLAKERNLFLMEGMWTRFFPALEQARRLVLGGSDGTKGAFLEKFQWFKVTSISMQAIRTPIQLPFFTIENWVEGPVCWLVHILLQQLYSSFLALVLIK
ncbi:dihydrodiol dehydrogenase / D-xylose 1-dehydrogenase (NADP) [Fistulifera solaris]|uniref:D-xylose 1-dehydrogenase (NADP(+), D-xylono-1,5-lactone-forming) n=1 Tax=Fistulifera solaris TaxID=1519565 RepID=A0A1Z5JMV7_FISSO|nr:dihydrodiol dehydrogenase / D-xylose 1-dehydrogenase (NADP) [Fistulifera solaris]|eukprot:GAX15118.1 dihydrodiol dehydrogenase / D-xylose 1-dehydrogenase (NADP) [Fistulifera solaris]